LRIHANLDQVVGRLQMFSGTFKQGRLVWRTDRPKEPT
jgi:hypothetical protein